MDIKESSGKKDEKFALVEKQTQKVTKRFDD